MNFIIIVVLPLKLISIMIRKSIHMTIPAVTTTPVPGKKKKTIVALTQ
jgi:hypothetical protein